MSRLQYGEWRGKVETAPYHRTIDGIEFRASSEEGLRSMESYYQTIEKAHGGPEKREYIFTNDINWIYKKNDWKNLKSIGMAIRTYTDKNGNEVKDISNIFCIKVRQI